MNFNHLHYFHVIATEGTLSRAAKRLGLSQPTLSAQLRNLEEYFGRKLFDRSSGSLRLNANGRKAIEVTHEMFRLGERLESLFPGERRSPVTRLEIGIATSVVRSFAVERFIGLFRNKDVLTRVRQGDHEYLHHELLTSGLDLFITDTPPDKRVTRGTIHRRLSSPDFAIIAPVRAARKLAAGMPESLHGQPFVHYSSHSAARFEIDQYFRKHRIEPDVVAEADDVYLIRDAVLEGIGFGVVPSSILRETVDRHKITAMGRVEGTFEIHAVYNRKDPTKEVLAALDLLADPES
ncbi:LysR family transcriptional regulator [Luteolibacter sp. SL250]|uniref:LysR family transcriptional regulator n=1 Tax=Luteolibacter sp. SL250 TaxID=2995170 RepID=UPI002270D4FA|nr:LysR family transcriptional regulator [Luteolibacter sp. SL250]WAC20414.1 LysR family transcriptional regulator [Luteolibacter sp. SL250]